MATQKLLAGILLANSLLFANQADVEPGVTKDHPQLEMDLRKAGYSAHDDPAAQRQTSVEFLDTEHLAISWLPSGRRTVVNPSEPTRLNVLMLDVKTGNKIGLQSNPTPRGAVRFSGVGEGKFVTCTGGQLRLFSKDFQELRTLELPNDHGCDGTLGTQWVSPSRTTMLLSDPWSGNRAGDKWLLNLETLERRAANPRSCQVISVSDHSMVGLCGALPEQKFFTRIFDQDWQPFRLEFDSSPVLAFVTDDLIAVGTRKRLAIATTDGKIVLAVKTSDHSFPLRFATSGGMRFAALEGKMRGLKSMPLDMYPFASQDRVVVYSVAERRAVWAINVKGTSPWAPWSPHLNHIALSPDGTALAIVSGDFLRVYRMP